MEREEREGCVRKVNNIKQKKMQKVAGIVVELTGSAVLRLLRRSTSKPRLYYAILMQ